MAYLIPLKPRATPRIARAGTLRHGRMIPGPESRASGSRLNAGGEGKMAKKSTKSESGVYRVTEVIGTSRVSWEDAASSAVKAAARSLRDLRIAEVTKLDMKVEGGKVVAYRARVSLSFKYEG
jgi:dodecin